MLAATAIAVAQEPPKTKTTKTATAKAATAKTATAETQGTEAKAPQGHDWPAFLGPTADGKSTERILLDWPETGPNVLWFRAVGEGYSAPSVADGRLFVFDRLDDTARLMAWDAATGEDLWTQGYATDYEDMFRYSGGPRTSPVVDDDRVYVFGVEGRLRAHRVTDGKLLWDVDTAERFGVVQNFFGVGSNPVVEGDLLIVHVGGSPPDSPRITSGNVQGNGTGIVAFDKHTGEVRYTLSDELASYATPRIVTLGDRRWGFVVTRGGLLAFEPSKGKADFFVPWRAKLLESVNASTPVVVDDTVFISESYGPGSVLLQVAPDTSEGYKILWKDPRRDQSLSLHWVTPIHHDGVLYASSGQSSGEAQLRAVDHRTGKVHWKVPGLGRSTLLYADGHLLVLTETGRLLLVKATPERYILVDEVDFSAGSSTENAEAKKATGERKVDKPRLRFPAWNAPVLAHGRLYLRGRDQVLALDLTPR